MMTREPDCSCVHCACPMFLFPTGTGWDGAKAAYARCGWDVPNPTCGECLTDRIQSGDIQFDRELWEASQ